MLKRISLMLAALVLLCTTGAVQAAAVVNSVTVNGGTSTTVSPGDPITVAVTVTLTNFTRWRSTEFFLSSPGNSFSVCSLAPDINANGTYTRIFTLTAPSGGLYTLGVGAWSNPNCNGSSSSVYSMPGAINTGPAPAALNHVRIIHDGSALTCSNETLTLRACGNAACTSLYTGSVTVSLGAAGTWSANPVTFSSGSTTVSLGNSAATNATLSGTVTAPTATKTTLTCYRGSTANDCLLPFTDGSCNLDAVEKGSGPNTPIFTKVVGAPLTLDALALINGVINPSSNQTVKAWLVEGTAAGCGNRALSSEVTWKFTNGEAGRHPLTLVPLEAAPNVRVRLTSGTLIQCSSDNFAIRPASFTLAVSGTATNTLNGTSTTATPVIKAGTVMALNAQSVNGYTGVPRLAQPLVQATAGNTGALTGSFAAASGGTALGSFRYAEVGYVSIRPFGVYDDGTFTDVDGAKGVPECFDDANLGTANAVADPNVLRSDGKYGCYFGSAALNHVGRFVPDRFVLADAIVNNRSSLSCTPASAFTYMGEPMQAVFTLIAQDAEGNTTTNYQGAFAKLDWTTKLGLAAINGSTPYAACGTGACFNLGPLANATFTEGVATGVTAPMTLPRPVTATAPLEAFKIGIAPEDPDGVRLPGYDLDTKGDGTLTHRLIAPTIVRYGRMAIDNNYGSELLGMRIKVAAQYYKGTGWAVNDLDRCTPLAGFTLDDFKNVTFAPAEVTGAGTLADGVGQLRLNKPSTVSGKGSARVNSSIPYLPGYGRQTFGVYKSGPVIHVRETY